MSLESLPWAISAGRNSRRADEWMVNAQGWQAYAKKLEKKVEFYRTEAINGWAAYRAVKNLSIQNTDYNPHSDPEFKAMKCAEFPSLKKELREDEPK